MTERTLVQIETPKTQNIEAVKALMCWQKIAADPLPVEVHLGSSWTAGPDIDGKPVLVSRLDHLIDQTRSPKRYAIILLDRGKHAKIDAVDSVLAGRSWHAVPEHRSVGNYTFYVARSKGILGQNFW